LAGGIDDHVLDLAGHVSDRQLQDERGRYRLQSPRTGLPAPEKEESLEETRLPGGRPWAEPAMVSWFVSTAVGLVFTIFFITVLGN